MFVGDATELSTLVRLDEEHMDHESASTVSDHQLLLDALRAGDLRPPSARSGPIWRRPGTGSPHTMPRVTPASAQDRMPTEVTP